MASRLSGEVLARTDDGSIRFREMTGKLDVETGDGSVVVGGTLTHLRAKTGDGSVRVAVEPGSRVEEDWTVETRDGSRRGAPARAGGRGRRRGDFRRQHPVQLSRADASIAPTTTTTDRSRRELRGTLGAGGRTLRVRTGDGTIRFER